MQKVIELKPFADAIHEIEQCCFMLGFVNDIDDLSDVEFYTGRIQRAVDDLRVLVKTARTVNNKKEGVAHG